MKSRRAPKITWMSMKSPEWNHLKLSKFTKLCLLTVPLTPSLSSGRCAQCDFRSACWCVLLRVFQIASRIASSIAIPLLSNREREREFRTRMSFTQAKGVRCIRLIAQAKTAAKLIAKLEAKLIVKLKAKLKASNLKRSESSQFNERGNAAMRLLNLRPTEEKGKRESNKTRAKVSNDWSVSKLWKYQNFPECF